MKISRFRHARDTVPDPWDITWDDFVDRFGPHDLLDVDVDQMRPEDLTHFKEGLAAFSPAEYPEEEKTRRKERVLRVHLLVLDVDERTDEELGNFVLRAQGLAMVVCSTFSRGIKSGARARVVMPLSRPVTRNEWPTFWRLANGLFDGIGDEQCKDANRIYFGCYAPKSKAGEHFYEVFEGIPLDVDAVLAMSIDEVGARATENLQPISHDQLKAFADRLAKRSRDDLSALGHALKKVCKGESFAEPGARDDTMFKLAREIMRRFPTGDPQSIVKHFAKSVELMTSEDSSCPSLDTFEYKLITAQADFHKKQLEKEQASLLTRQRRIQQAFGADRTHPYTDEELDNFDKPEWIVQCGKSYYFFVNGDYVGPYTDADAGNAALSLLAPVPESTVDLWTVSDTGVKRKPINDLVAYYGSVAKEVRMDLRAQTSTFDKRRLIFTEATCPLRPLEPQKNEEIEQWLEIMGGKKHHELLSWVAALTMLDDPCVALFFTGPKGVGKNLFAEGHARLWSTEGPSDLEEIFDNFNDSLAQCPLCFADEQLPTDIRGYVKNGQLRTHVQARTRAFKRKFIPSAKLVGATRTIIAANNEDILRTQETLTANDIGAIADRYLHIEVTEEARHYLEAVDTRGWVDGDKIASHALWLRDNYEWEVEGRFLIKVKDQSLARGLATAGGINSQVCQWLASYLQHPHAFESDTKSKGFVRVHKQQLLVNIQGLINCWEKYVQNNRCPSTAHLSTAIAALSSPGRVRLVNELGVRTNYRIIDIENLVVWAERTGFVTREVIEEGLGHQTTLANAASKMN